MLRTQASIIAMMAIFSAWNFLLHSALAADCKVCTTNYTNATVATEILKRNQDLLDRNKKALTTLSEDDVSKRVKIASNILILTTRVEIQSNTKLAADKILFESKCNLCPKPRPEEIEKALKGAQ